MYRHLRCAADEAEGLSGLDSQGQLSLGLGYDLKIQTQVAGGISTRPVLKLADPFTSNRLMH